jgi:hypothetical protein
MKFLDTLWKVLTNKKLSPEEQEAVNKMATVYAEAQTRDYEFGLFDNNLIKQTYDSKAN